MLKVPLAQIARELKVRPDQLRAWPSQVAGSGGVPPRVVFPGEGRLPSADEEVRQLRRELDAVRQERDFLKKCAGVLNWSTQQCLESCSGRLRKRTRATGRLARDFVVGRAVNTAWASDVTFIPTLSGWLYLAVVVDLSSRRLPG